MGRTLAGLASALLLAALVAGGAAQSGTAKGASADPRRAFLARGADAVKGLPFFPTNAIPALSGVYRLGGGPPGGAAPKDGEVSVWYTREPLILKSSWKRIEFAGFDAFALARPRGNVLVLKGASYHLFFELPAGAATDDPGRRAFVKAFERKFSVFFENAASDTELSFPAYVDY